MLQGPQSCLSLLEREISAPSQKSRGREQEMAGFPPLPSGQEPHLQVQHLLIKARTKKWMFFSCCNGVKAPLKQICKAMGLGCIILCPYSARRLIMMKPQRWHFKFQTHKSAVMGRFVVKPRHIFTEFFSVSVTLMDFKLLFKDSYLTISIWKRSECRVHAVRAVNMVSRQNEPAWFELLLLFSLRLAFRMVINGRIRGEGCPLGGSLPFFLFAKSPSLLPTPPP